MVDKFNIALSYDFIPKVIELLKHSIVYCLIGLVVFLTLAMISFILKGLLQKTFSGMAIGALVITILALFITVVSAVMIPTLFCIVSLKIGIMDIFGFTELWSGLISSLFCIMILSLIVELCLHE